MTPTPQLSLGLLLTAAAGMIDVVGFIELGGFYTSFMSGNTTQLGAGLAGGLRIDVHADIDLANMRGRGRLEVLS